MKALLLTLWMTSAVLAGAGERPVLPPSPPVGPHIALAADGLGGSAETLLESTGLAASGAQLLDYTFASAPTEWEPTGGSWQVFSRFACDPSWSFFGGYSQGLAAIWNKRLFSGDVTVEAYVSFKHGLPWNPISWSYRPADLSLSLCGDGQNPAAGYSFIYAADEGSRTLIRRGSTVLASTSRPEFLSPSYSDTRPATEDFHRRWWQLVAQKTGDRLRFWIDGRLALETTDPAPLEQGRIGLWTVRNGMMVARVRVAYQQELKRQEPLLVVTDPVPLPAAITQLAAR
ncbi:MAG: hypothetical protein IT204_18745 [Fimbriimonadaceae bacterium]|nr:hypothetical protein [Fimbriimonadaceae bacterium]